MSGRIECAAATGVSLVVVNYGSPGLVQDLLKSLQGHPDRNVVSEVILVDNGYPETGDLREAVSVAEFDLRLQFVQNPERSYSSGVNRGVEACSGNLLIISNNDIEWLPDHTIRPLLRVFDADPQVGIAGPQLVFPDGRWQRSYGPFPSVRQGVSSLLLTEILHNGLAARKFSSGRFSIRNRPIAYIDGAFMMIRRQCFEELSGFDEQCGFYGEDVDFCWRAHRMGWRRIHVPTATIKHVRGASSKAIAPTEYSNRGLKAKCDFVARIQGEKSATCFVRLVRFHVWELALFYRTIAWFFRTPPMRRRAKVAAAAAEAASRFRWSLDPDSETP